jgi:hypothetical protein
MELIDKLNFSMPNFNRITWVSEELKNNWEPIINQLPLVIDDFFTSNEVVNLVPIQIKFINPNKVYNYKKEIIRKGLFAEHLETNILFDNHIYCRNKSFNSIPVVIGTLKNVTTFIRSMKDISIEKESKSNKELSDIPFLGRQYLTKNITDQFWGYLLSENNEKVEQNKTLDNNILNPYWASFGISSIPYLPNRLDCSESFDIALKIKEIAKNNLSKGIFDAWYEILSWPIEWSALHGIAEIKTPLFKMIYNTDATGTKYSMQLKSETYPEKGLKGLLFPYKKPKKLYFSESLQFNRGVEHLNKSIK